MVPNFLLLALVKISLFRLVWHHLEHSVVQMSGTNVLVDLLGLAVMSYSEGY